MIEGRDLQVVKGMLHKLGSFRQMRNRLTVHLSMISNDYQATTRELRGNGERDLCSLSGRCLCPFCTA
jgi:hypothetical protein